MHFRFALIAAGTLFALACGSGSPTGPSGTSGTFNMMIKDTPFADAKAVLVTFSDVSVHKDGESESSWTKLAFSGGTTRTCDLKKLQTATDVLGVGTLAAGHYTQVRLTVSSAMLYFDNASSGSACAATIAAPGGAGASLTIPSGEVKLNREFTVAASAATTMTIDFDGDRSIHQTGSGTYMMSPVIAVVSVQ
jgi:hypothetical protein